jgi:hypothetical protein
MKVAILYHPNSEFARMVESYAHDFERTRGKSIELVSLDTVEGADLARLYDITVYPAMVVVREDGQLMKDWQGEPMPLMNEVAGYLEQ